MSRPGPAASWEDMLRSSLATRVLHTTSGAGDRLAWALFRRGPLVLAYPRFPVGLLAGDLWVREQWDGLQHELKSQGVDLLRMSAPARLLSTWPGVRVESSAPETVVEPLAGWHADRLPSAVRRKFRQAEKSGLRVQPAQAGDGAVCHRLYARSVSRQRGSMRYGVAYFEDLCALSAAGGAATVAKAVTPDGAVAGFVATLRDADSVYYLHGGYADDFAAMRPGYFLMRWALEHARDAAAARFNLLTSPPSQPALLAYKESFGGSSELRGHWQQPLTPLGRVAAWSLSRLASARRSADPQAMASNRTSA